MKKIFFLIIFVLTQQKKLKIAQFDEVLVVGGIERGLSILLKHFLKKKEEVEIILLTCEKKKYEYHFDESIKRFIVCHHHKLNYEYIQKVLIENNIDIIINHRENNQNLNKFAKSLGVKVIQMWHGPIVHRLNQDVRNFHDFDIFITLFNHDVLFLKKYIGIENGLYMPNPITFNPKKIIKSSLSSNNIVMVGRANSIKNYEFGIKVLSLVIKKIPQANLILVGFHPEENNYTKKLEKLSKSLNISKNVIFTKKTTDVGDYYRNSSIFLLSSYSEGYPYVLSEAKAYGLGVVVAGLPYLTGAKKGVVLIEDYDVKKVSEEIIQLLTDREYLKKMGKLASENVYEITNDELIDRWIEVFKSVKEGNITGIQKKFNDYSPSAFEELKKEIKRKKKLPYQFKVFKKPKINNKIKKTNNKKKEL